MFLCRHFLVVAGAIAFVGAAAFAVAALPAPILSVHSDPLPQPAATATPAATWMPHPDPDNLRNTITVQIVKHSEPAIVSISAKKLVTQRVNPFGNSMFMPQFNFGPLVRVPANFLGSGFIIQSQGYVVTNNHVVNQAREIHIQLANGQKYSAHVVGADPAIDLAILKINSTAAFHTLPLGLSNDLMIGEPTIAVGNPFGYSQSVSSGIVSAIHRQIQEPDNPKPLTKLIQTDAAINPGNSGGPLLNAYGQVIGINTAIRGNAQNIGFAIGVDRLEKYLPTLMSPALVNGLDIPIKLAAVRSITEPAAIIEHVVLAGTKGPAIESIDGTPTPTLVDACAALLAVKPAQKAVVIRFADGSVKQYPVSILPPSPVVTKARKLLGLGLVQMTPALAQRYGMQVQSGLLVKLIEKNSIGARAGLEPGDVIVQLGPYRIRTLHDLGLLLPRLPATGRVRVLVVRNGKLGMGVLTFP